MNSTFCLYRSVLVFIILSFCTAMYSQGLVHNEEGESSIFLIARPSGDSIMLRWAPDEHRLWLIGNKYGYQVTRSCLIKNGEFVANPVTELLTPTPLMPIPLADWEAMAETNELAGVAAEAIYGDQFDVNVGYGGIADIVNRVAEQENRFGFALLAADLSREVALASGLMYIDRGTKPGEKYVYKVFPAFLPDGMDVDTGYFFTGVDEYLPLPAPTNVQAEPEDKGVMLSWDGLFQGSVFTAFWVERSLNGVDFERLDNSPVINTTPVGYEDSRLHFYRDSLADNNHLYYYRILGVTPFGETSPPSAIVKVKGINEIQSVPRITSAESFDGLTMTLEWEFEPMATEVIEGFKLLRSDRFDGDYEVISDHISVMRKQIDDPHPLATGYYRMQAYNSDGDGPLGTPRMVQMVDSIPPAPPVGLSAKADTSGMVLLTWQPNSELDLFGYRVFRANSLHEEFSQITAESVYANCFTDTISLKTLTKKVYYKILAVDQRQNWSAFSEVLEVDRPDVVPPAPPRISSVRSVDNGIEVSWVLSPSSDVEQQLLYRNNENNRQWQLIKIMDAKTTQFVDSMVLPDILNRYLFVVVDSAGNESKPGKAVGGKVSALKLEEVKDLEVELDKNENVAKLKWTYQRSDVVYFIYRKKGNNSELISSTESKFFFDELLSGSHDVSYAIVVKSSHSGMSGFSEFVSFNKKK